MPPLLLHHFLLLLLFFTFQTRVSFSLQPKPFVLLALKTQTLNPKPSLDDNNNNNNKLSFRHNVTLTISLTVGSPPQNVTMVLDTGSDLSYLHCSKTPTQSNVFSPRASNSYSPIPCSSATCHSQTRDLNIPVSCDNPTKLCHVTLSYADASSLEGTLARDTFSFGSGGSARPGFLFGCMDSTGFSSNSEEDAKTTGLLGMNRGSLSFITQMGYRSFSYCISDRDDADGVLLFGDVTFPWLGPLNYTPLVHVSKLNPLPYFDPVAYTVQLEGIRVGSKLLNLPGSVFKPDHTGAGQTMVDSGTQFTFLLGPVYSALKTEFVSQTRPRLKLLNDKYFVFQGAMDLCFLGSGDTWGDVVMRLPDVTMVLEGAEMRVSGERLVYRVEGMVRGSDQVYCFTFGNADLLGIEAFVIGHYHQQNVWMDFDLERSRVGVAQVRCDLASKKLGLGH